MYIMQKNCVYIKRSENYDDNKLHFIIAPLPLHFHVPIMTNVISYICNQERANPFTREHLFNLDMQENQMLQVAFSFEMNSLKSKDNCKTEKDLSVSLNVSESV